MVGIFPWLTPVFILFLPGVLVIFCSLLPGCSESVALSPPEWWRPQVLRYCLVYVLIFAPVLVFSCSFLLLWSATAAVLLLFTSLFFLQRPCLLSLAVALTMSLRPDWISSSFIHLSACPSVYLSACLSILRETEKEGESVRRT